MLLAVVMDGAGILRTSDAHRRVVRQLHMALDDAGVPLLMHAPGSQSSPGKCSSSEINAM